MKNTVRLFLALGEDSGIGYWSVDYTDMDTPQNITGQKYLECYRNHVVGIEAAIEIKEVITDNLLRLAQEINEEDYNICIPHVGISFDLPLEIVEKIFDFWFENYSDRILWNKYKKLAKFRCKTKNISHILDKSFKGDSSYCYSRIHQLYNFRPSSKSNKILSNDFMW